MGKFSEKLNEEIFFPSTHEHGVHIFQRAMLVDPAGSSISTSEIYLDFGKELVFFHKAHI